MRERFGPLHSLADFHRLLGSYNLRGSVIDRAMPFVAAARRGEAVPKMMSVLRSLTEEDFDRSHLATYGRCDMYAKIDRYGLWYVKFSIADGVLAVHSCHESGEDEVTLRNGKTLTKPSDDEEPSPGTAEVQAESHEDKDEP